jgi:hypothetical protein
MDFLAHTEFSSAPICTTCGTQYPPRSPAASECPICLDERQYVGWAGQRWTTSAELLATREIQFEDSAGVMTMFVEPSFAIGQRAFLIPHEDGVVMWECLSMVTEAALARLAEMGGVRAIAISHPHFYAAMNEWSAALGGVPIYLHAADREWVRFRTSSIRFWSGDRLALSDELELVHLPGHFAGSAGLWWKRGPRAGGSLFPGDALQVAMDRRFTTFMYSYPNAIPLGPAALARLEACTSELTFHDVYGFSRGRQIIGDGKARVAASFARYRSAIAA